MQDGCRLLECEIVPIHNDPDLDDMPDCVELSLVVGLFHGQFLRIVYRSRTQPLALYRHRPGKARKAAIQHRLARHCVPALLGKIQRSAGVPIARARG